MSSRTTIDLISKAYQRIYNKYTNYGSKKLVRLEPTKLSQTIKKMINELFRELDFKNTRAKRDELIEIISDAIKMPKYNKYKSTLNFLVNSLKNYNNSDNGGTRLPSPPRRPPSPKRTPTKSTRTLLPAYLAKGGTRKRTKKRTKKRSITKSKK
jgi:hypothetical protein